MLAPAVFASMAGHGMRFSSSSFHSPTHFLERTWFKSEKRNLSRFLWAGRCLVALYFGRSFLGGGHSFYIIVSVTLRTLDGGAILQENCKAFAAWEGCTVSCRFLGLRNSSLSGSSGE